MKQIKLAIELNTPTLDESIYTGQFLDALDYFIQINGITVLHNENDTLQNNFIGVITSYDLLKEKIIILNLNILNNKFQHLQNLEQYLVGLPKIIGTVNEDKTITVDSIEYISIIL